MFAQRRLNKHVLGLKSFTKQSFLSLFFPILFYFTIKNKESKNVIPVFIIMKICSLQGQLLFPPSLLRLALSPSFYLWGALPQACRGPGRAGDGSHVNELPLENGRAVV